MVRSELIQLLSDENSRLDDGKIEASVATFFAEIERKLVAGGRVELRGFGSFTARARSGRTGRNPRSGEAVSIPQKSMPFFRASKTLATAIQKVK